MNKIAKYVKTQRRQLGLTQEEFALRSGLGLRFVRELEQGKMGSADVLSPAYDLLPVNVIMPEDMEETALTLNGKKSNLKRKDFIAFADKVGVNSKAANRLIDSVISRTDDAPRMCRARI